MKTKFYDRPPQLAARATLGAFCHAQWLATSARKRKQKLGKDYCVMKFLVVLTLRVFPNL